MKKSVADADPRSGAFLNPGSGIGKKSGSRSGMNNPDHIFESLEQIFWVNILFGKNSDSGPRIRNTDEKCVPKVFTPPTF
jgi:hypothetical protein